MYTTWSTLDPVLKPTHSKVERGLFKPDSLSTLISN
jgi:hypothetical protein